ncbi:hypothetical protein PVK06_039008 [Gossypium arboreum]|uniref:DC1 domain-containing protein n=1 Tax=Gossypium arboreum TaxID=29729 RepID=A0ABR0N4E7_GOSAR|nr:hypothetical protein PVK06_039008 [Gossypium arboreum]
MTSIPRQLINHLIHPCTLLFLTTRFSHYCDKCGEDIISRIEFRCHKCYFYLHVKCALLPTVDSEDAKEIQHFSHPHPLALIENHKDFNNEPRCVACVETCLAPTPAFRCSRRSCNHFFLHKSCTLKLPCLRPHINHPSHPQHKLTTASLLYNDEIRPCGACYMGFDSCLIAYSYPKIVSSISTQNNKPQISSPSFTTYKSPLEYELNSKEEAYNSDDEFSCDVCKEKRNKRELIYFCEECRFIAEVKCVLSAVLPFLCKKYIWSSEEEFSNEEEFSSEEEQDEEEISKEDVREEAKSFLEIPKLHVEKILLNCIRLNERQHILEVEMKEGKA